MNRFFLLMALLMWWLAPPAGAAIMTSTDTDSIAMTKTTWTNSLTLIKFNPALGTLLGIELTLKGDLDGSAKFESKDAAPQSVTTVFSARIALQAPDTHELLAAIPTSTQVDSVTAYDGTLDFDGTSGKTYPQLNATKTETHSYLPTDPDAAIFIGTGDVTLQVAAVGQSHADGPGNLDVGFRTNAGAEATVTYYYTPVPEPSAMVGGLLFGAAALLRRRARR